MGVLVGDGAENDELSEAGPLDLSHCKAFILLYKKLVIVEDYFIAIY